MRTIVVRWLPWLLAMGALGVFLVIPGVNGPVLALVWGAIVIAVRYAIAILADRRSRLMADGIFIFGCFLAAFEGGWYLLPAAFAFVAQDRADVGVRDPLHGLKRSQSWLAGVSAAGVGFAALAIALWGPLYSSRSASIVSGTAVDGPLSSASLAALGLTPRASLVFVAVALLLAVIAIASSVHARTANRWAHRLLAIAILGLALIAIAGAFTIGPLLLPAIILAVLAWAAGRNALPQGAA